MDARTRWLHYVASFVKIEPTEGVPTNGRWSMPFLRRLLPAEAEESDERQRTVVPELTRAGSQMIICVNSYRIMFKPGAPDVFVHSEKHRALGPDGKVLDQERARTGRRNRFRNWLKKESPLVQSKGEEGMARVDQDFRAWVDDGILPSERRASSKKSSNRSSVSKTENEINDDDHQAVENCVTEVPAHVADEDGDHPMEDA